MELSYCTAFNEHWFTLTGDNVIQRLSAIQSSLSEGDRIVGINVSDITLAEVRVLVEFLVNQPAEVLKGLPL